MEKFLEKLKGELDNVEVKDKELITLSGITCKYLRARRAKAIVNTILALKKEEWLYDTDLLRSELGQDILASIFVGEDNDWVMPDIEVMNVMKTIRRTFKYEKKRKRRRVI